MRIKSLIKRFVPNQIIDIYKAIIRMKCPRNDLNKYLHNYKQYHNYDIMRSIKHTNSINRNNTPEKIIALIVTVYHTIEKGLTMGNMSLGFGLNQLNYLIELCELYINKYGLENEMLKEALGVISEYALIHESNGNSLESSLKERINNLLTKSQLNYTTHQLNYTKVDYFKYTNSSFDLFSNSRHSLRDFNENIKINIETIEEAINLAQNAPSTCNRQSARLHLISNKELIEEVLKLQKGNRGFGNRTDKLIIVTSDLNCWGGPNERFGPFIDAGIYTMNLLYSLHFYKVGAVPLNWYSSVEDDVKLRDLIAIPDNEVIAVIIACGGLNDNFKVAKSKRRDIRSIVKIYNC